MSKSSRTPGFGAPDVFGAHVFQVDIPASGRGPVVILEDYGYQGDQRGIPATEPRVRLTHDRWLALAEGAADTFNRRLLAARQRSGCWQVGANRLDRLLGRELCVLAWAAEYAPTEDLPVILRRWDALRPEERWWLFAQTAAETGCPEDGLRGWRMALRAALSDPGRTSGEAGSLRPMEEPARLPVP